MNLKITGLGIVFILCIGLLVWVGLRHPVVNPPEPKPTKSKAELRAERDAFFKADVEPSIKEADKLNREAADRCVTRLKESFDGYRTGIQPFCKEINTLGTQLGVLRRMPSDWWYEQNDVSDYIQAKFAKHLFTDKKLSDDIESALAQYRADVEANQASLITSIRAAISSTDLPGLPDIEYTEFSNDLSARLTAYGGQAGIDSVVRGIMTEVTSGVGGVVAEQLLAQLLVRLKAMAGLGGSAGGPIGAVAGIAVGLTISVVIDWWMSSSLEAKMMVELNGLIDELNNELIAGDANRPGLRYGLRESCDVIRQACQDSLRNKIVDGGAL